MHYFAKRINEENALGILATSWAASNSLAKPADYWEYYWYSQLASAEYAWTGGEIDITDYAHSFLQNFYGIQDEIFANFLTKTEEEKIQSLHGVVKHLESVHAIKNKSSYNLFRNFLKRLHFQAQYNKIIEDDFRKVAKYKEDAITKIDLKPFANRGYCDKGKNPGWANEGINDMIEFPSGKNIFGGIPFDINEPDTNNKAIICMNNVMDQDELPELIEGIPVNAKCKTINFIHSLSKNDVPPGACIGHYVFQYKDGKTEEINVARDNNITNWWRSLSSNKTITIWRGKNRVTKDNHIKIGISLFQWKNPYPEKEIDTMSIRTEGNPSWLIMAINAVKYQENTESETDDWLALKEQIKFIERNFHQAWEEEEKALKNFISDNLIEFYRYINYQPIKDNFKSSLTL